MSSTTTSETSKDSSDTSSEVTQQAQDLFALTKVRTKRQRDDEAGTTSHECSTKDDEKSKDETKEPEKKKRKMRRMESKKVEGYVINVRNVNEEIVKNICEEFKDPIVLQAFPNVKCELIPTKYIKLLPTEKEKQEWQAETKRLSKQRLKEEGKEKKQLTEAEKEQRRLKNADPEYQKKKKEMAKIKRKVFNDNEENKKKYKEIVKQVLGETPRKKRSLVKTDEK